MRSLTTHLYAGACAQYDSAHGLCGARGFDTANQGSITSPGRARLLLMSLAEAISLVCDGFRCWGTAKRVTQLILADDLLGLFGSWGSARVFMRVVCDWCEVTGHRMGIHPFPYPEIYGRAGRAALTVRRLLLGCLETERHSKRCVRSA